MISSHQDIITGINLCRRHSWLKKICTAVLTHTLATKNLLLVSVPPPPLLLLVSVPPPLLLLVSVPPPLLWRYLNLLRRNSKNRQPNVRISRIFSSYFRTHFFFCSTTPCFRGLLFWIYSCFTVKQSCSFMFTNETVTPILQDNLARRYKRYESSATRTDSANNLAVFTDSKQFPSLRAVTTYCLTLQY